MNQPRDTEGRYGAVPRSEAGVALLDDHDARMAEARALYGDCVTDHHIELPAGAHVLLDRFRDAGMNPLLGGGSVRDSFDDNASAKDLDFEVYGGSIDQVQAIAATMGRVDAVGKKFGVLKMRLVTGEDVDLSVPRRDNKVGTGHTGFTVDMDPDMSVAAAAERRDYTVNAILYDPRLDVAIDPHDGRRDLDDGILRHVSATTFAEDPLRVVRGMQFASRFGMYMHPDTAELARTLRPEAPTLHDNGVSEEWAKWARRSRRPSDGLRVLHQTGWDAEFPGLAEINDAHLAVEVNSTNMVMRGAQAYAGRYDERVVLGAVLMRRMSAPDQEAFAARTILGKDAQKRAVLLARDDRPLPTSGAEAREQALTGATIRERCLMVAGRGNVDRAADALHRAAQEGVTDTSEKDLLVGEDIMATAPGLRPGRWIAETVEAARLAQARGEFRDRDAALEWLAANKPG